MTLKGKLVRDEFEAIVFFNNCNMIVHLLYNTLHFSKLLRIHLAYNYNYWLMAILQ